MAVSNKWPDSVSSKGIGLIVDLYPLFLFYITSLCTIRCWVVEDIENRSEREFHFDKRIVHRNAL
jgi:hypothetical protein